MQSIIQGVFSFIFLCQDTTRRARLRKLVESVGSEGSVPTNIRYHATCYRIHTRNLEENYQVDEEIEEVYTAAREMFLKSVERSLFQEGEMRTLKSLKEEYEQIREGFGILGETRTTFVKDCLVNKFGDRIVIQKRYEVSFNKDRNKASDRLNVSNVISSLSYSLPIESPASFLNYLLQVYFSE